MAELVSDELWKQIEPLVAAGAGAVSQGRSAAGDAIARLWRASCLCCRTGIPWQSLPTEMDCGSGSTCWRRFAEWTELSRLVEAARAACCRNLGKAGAINL